MEVEGDNQFEENCVTTESKTEYQDDVYGDIDDFDLGTEIEKVIIRYKYFNKYLNSKNIFQAYEKNKLLEQNIAILQKDKEKLIEAIDVLTAQQNQLKTNISSLYLTAKTEIDRKNRIITDLRTELEDLKFRRVGKRKWQNNYEDNKPVKMPKIDLNAQTCNVHTALSRNNVGDIAVKKLHHSEIVRNVPCNKISQEEIIIIEDRYIFYNFIC